MTTIRRGYWHLAAFVGLVMAAIGLSALIGLIVDRGFDAFRDAMISTSAPAVALIVVGGATWRVYWRRCEREALAALDERACGTRQLYLYGVMALSFLAALIVAQQWLSDLLTRLLIIGWNGYKPWTPLLIAALLIAVWRWHEWIALLDQSAQADGPRGGDLRRGYWFIIAAFGLVMTIGALLAFVSTLFSWLGDPGSSRYLGRSALGWGQALILPLTQAIVGWIALGLTWQPAQSAAAAGNEVERSSRLRSILIHATVLGTAILVLGGAQLLLTDILGRLLRGESRSLLVSSANGALTGLIVGGLIGWYFFKKVRATLPSPRLSEYIIMGVAFVIGVAGVAWLLNATLQLLGGRGARIEDWIINAGPLLLIGAIWRRRWPRLQQAVATAATPEPRQDVWRTGYLYLFQFGGLTLVLIGAVIVLQSFLASLLGQRGGYESANILYQLAGPLTALIVGFGLMWMLGRITADDARLSGLTGEELLRHTLGDQTPTWALLLFGYVVIAPLWVIVILALLGPVIGNVFSNVYGSLP
jgi:hypothetical protein